MSREWPRAALDRRVFSLSADRPWACRTELMRQTVASTPSARVASAAAACECAHEVARAWAPVAATSSAIAAIARMARWRPVRNMLRTYEPCGALPTGVHGHAIGLACHAGGPALGGLTCELSPRACCLGPAVRARWARSRPP